MTPLKHANRPPFQACHVLRSDGLRAAAAMGFAAARRLAPAERRPRAQSPSAPYHRFKVLEVKGYALSSVRGRCGAHPIGSPVLGRDMSTADGASMR